MTLDTEALTSITQTMLRVWYGNDTTLTVGDMSRAVHRCCELFQFMNDDDKQMTVLSATVELCHRYNIKF